MSEVGDAEAVRFWGRVAGGAAAAARVAGRAAVAVGEAAAAAYRAVDPDVRRHLAQLPLLGLTMLAPRRAEDELATLPDDGHPPVLFVHGLGGHPGNFLPMRTYFRWRGRRRTSAVSLEPGAPMAALADGLRATLARAAAASGSARVDVVAHSLGGLVTRLALEDPATAACVRTLITLGSPHAGTHLARFAATTGTLALRPGSEVVAQLARQLPWRGPPTLPRLVAFWSGADVMLLPPESARVDGAEDVEMPGYAHGEYLLRPDAWRAVWDALEGS